MFETVHRVNVAIVKAKEIVVKSDDKTKVATARTFLSIVQMILDNEHTDINENVIENLKAMEQDLAIEIAAY